MKPTRVEIQQIMEFVKKYEAQFNHPEDEWHFTKEVHLIEYALKRILEIRNKII